MAAKLEDAQWMANHESARTTGLLTAACESTLRAALVI
jgi:hypothetical protein